MKKPFFSKGPHNILFAAGIVGCLFFLEALFHQMYLEYDFRVLAIETKCEQPLNNRCIYKYSVKHKDGSVSKVELDGYLFREEELAVGNSIKKEKFSFEYLVNGERTVWGFANYFLLIFFASISSLWIWRHLTTKRIAQRDR
jgi:hypothetical protein